MGVLFDLNNTVVKIGMEFNARINTRFRDKCRETERYSNTDYLVHLQVRGSWQAAFLSIITRNYQLKQKKEFCFVFGSAL